MNKNIVITTVVALSIGLFGGYAAARASVPVSANVPNMNYIRGNAGGLRGGNQNASGFLVGTVVKKDSGSITVDTRDNNSHVVLFTPATSVFKSVAGSLADITVGSAVIVSGSTNSDGSLSANSIQLRRTDTPATIGR